jgi:hypothetical protein
MGRYPLTEIVGASAGVYGVYGAFIGCYLRGLTTIPWKVLCQRIGFLLLFSGAFMVLDWLEPGGNLVAHLGGLVCGFALSLVFGHVFHKRYVRLAGLIVGCILAIGFTIFLAMGMHNCARQALAITSPLESAKQRERELLGQFDEALTRWEQGDFTDAQMKSQLETNIIPQWEKARTEFNLGFSADMAVFEKMPYSLHDFMKLLRADPELSQSRNKEALTAETYGSIYRLQFKLRIDNLRALARELGAKQPMLEEIFLDMIGIEFMRHGTEEVANEDNPLGKWLPTHKIKGWDKRK